MNRASTSVNKCEKENIINKSSQNKQNTSVGIEKVVSLINYFRLIYKILDKLKQAQLNVSQNHLKSQL